MRHELILGGQKSGKSRRAEQRAATWLATSPVHRAVFIATAQPWDEEMQARISRHQRDRAERVPGMVTVEEPLQLAQAIAEHSRPGTLLVIDCLTLWLTNVAYPQAPAQSALRPPPGRGHHRQTGGAGSAVVLEGDGLASSSEAAPAFTENSPPAQIDPAAIALFLGAIESAAGPLVLVGNEIGLGVIPLGREVRAFVDALGSLNQQVAQRCHQVTLMVAGLPLSLKGAE